PLRPALAPPRCAGGTGPEALSPGREGGRPGQSSRRRGRDREEPVRRQVGGNAPDATDGAGTHTSPKRQRGSFFREVLKGLTATLAGASGWYDAVRISGERIPAGRLRSSHDGGAEITQQ